MKMQLGDFPSSEDLSYQLLDCQVKISGIHNGDEAEQWLKDYGSLHNTVWRVLRTYPRSTVLTGKLFVYKKQFRCQHNTKAKLPIFEMSDHEPAAKRHKSKNTNCPAKVLITISRKPSDYSCSVTFMNVHNHPTTSSEALHYQPVSEEARSHMEELYRRGHTPATAYVTFCQRKSNLLGAEGFAVARSDRRVVPSKGDFYSEWKRRFQHEQKAKDTETRGCGGQENDLGAGNQNEISAGGADDCWQNTKLCVHSDGMEDEFDGADINTAHGEEDATAGAKIKRRTKGLKYRTALNREDSSRRLQDWCGEYASRGRGQCRLAQLAESSGTNYLAVALITPLMRRVHQLPPESHQVLYVDAPDYGTTLRHRVYFFLAASPAGGLPLGMVITDHGKSRVFEAGLDALKSLLPCWAFGGNGSPSTIVLGSCGALGDSELFTELHALCNAWPEARVILGATTVLQGCWRWVQNGGHKVDHQHWQAHYALFKDVVYGADETALEVAYEKLKAESLYQSFTSYVGRLWQHRQLWAACYRIPAEEAAPDYTRTAFGLRVNAFMSCTRAFLLLHLVDFIGYEFDDFYRRSLVDVLQGKSEARLFRKQGHPPPATGISESTSGALDAPGEPLLTSRIAIDPSAAVPLTQCMYLVPSETKPGIYYIADMNVGLCSCTPADAVLSDRQEGFCKHQLVLVEHHVTTAVQQMTPTDKAALYRVATGIGLFVKSETTPTADDVAQHQAPYLVDSALTVRADPAYEEVTPQPAGNVIAEGGSMVQETEMILASVFDEISKMVRDDPVALGPAVQRFRDNFSSFMQRATTSSAFVAGLEAAFLSPR